VGAEDITIDAQSGIAFLSCDDRRAPKRGDTLPGAIFALDLKTPSPTLHAVSGTFGGRNFHPHGISFYRHPDGQMRLFVVNHPRGESATIEVFSWDGHLLTHEHTFSSPLLFSPNDVCGVGLSQFYASNDHGSRSNFGWFWEAFLKQRKSYVVYFDGERFTRAARRISYANGVNASADGNYLYVAGVLRGTLHTYRRDTATGALTQISTLKMKSGLDNIELDEEGFLWIASHPKPFKFLKHALDSTQVSPWEIFRVNVANPAFPSYVRVYKYSGKGFSGASVAAVWRQHILVGTVFEDRVWKGLIQNQR
jgi:arylesterase/paraoxonase